MRDWIGHTRILGDGLVCEVNLAVLVKCDVLKECVALDCVVDVRLAVLVEVDDLCIATALEVEDAVVPR